VAEDRVKAKEYFEKAAEKGSKNAKDVLAEYYNEN
jgi:TPR repeat protein